MMEGQPTGGVSFGFVTGLAGFKRLLPLLPSAARRCPITNRENVARPSSRETPNHAPRHAAGPAGPIDLRWKTPHHHQESHCQVPSIQYPTTVFERDETDGHSLR
jgi:hypothetical protein